MLNRIFVNTMLLATTAIILCVCRLLGTERTQQYTDSLETVVNGLQQKAE